MRKRHGVLLVLVALAAAVALMFGGLAMATGETDEIISNVLTASVGITAEIEEPQVALTWALGTEAGKPDESEFSDDALELDMVIGEPIYVWVRTENQSDAPIENVLFLIETVGAGDVFTIESTGAENGSGWAGTLPYADSLGTHGAYHYGDAGGDLTGFPMPADHDVYSEFKVTANQVGNFSVDVYTVKRS